MWTLRHQLSNYRSVLIIFPSLIPLLYFLFLHTHTYTEDWYSFETVSNLESDGIGFFHLDPNRLLIDRNPSRSCSRQNIHSRFRYQYHPQLIELLLTWIAEVVCLVQHFMNCNFYASKLVPDTVYGYQMAFKGFRRVFGKQKEREMYRNFDFRWQQVHL